MTQPPFRNEAPAEIISFHAHAGKCRYCGGIVKMLKDNLLVLHPDQCWCLQCGQPYYVEVAGTLELWDEEQWQQKREERVFRTLVLYQRPKDFPQHYVTRWQDAIAVAGEITETRPAPIACLYDSADEAFGDTAEAYGWTLTWLPRYADDDPVIMGVWI